MLLFFNPIVVSSFCTKTHHHLQFGQLWAEQLRLSQRTGHHGQLEGRVAPQRQQLLGMAPRRCQNVWGKMLGSKATANRNAEIAGILRIRKSEWIGCTQSLHRRSLNAWFAPWPLESSCRVVRDVNGTMMLQVMNWAPSSRAEGNTINTAYLRPAGCLICLI